MANISQNVNIEMLEKLPDGTYKRKYPKTRSDTGVTFDEHLADDVTIKHKGKEIGLEDTASNFTNKNVEGAMSELFTNVSNGKQLVGNAITDVDDSAIIPTEPSFNDLAGAIGRISTGRRWASGYKTASQVWVSVSRLSFKPSIVIIIDSSNPSESITVYNELIDKDHTFKFRSTSGGGKNALSSANKINPDGFYLSVYGSGKRFHWTAIE